ncbi:hypothetical protein [Spirosoma oryzicola]|uniref:hypothetical protein n=1 Tax=Spirosoma oryzicola TaxID=2898794 RepID=UPI001E57F8ED|nr:hypothetical protein [Spirosoma oryzicola]UHG93425.1 hypothetical protein LQ777_11085 [Spirosoma oryzicola]
MTLAQRVTLFAQAIAVDIKSLYGKVGNLANLTTTAKGDLVSALNEVKASVGVAGAQIDDTAASSTKVYSSSKTESFVNAKVAALVNAAPTTLDTLKELSDALGGDANFATTTTTALGKRVGVDAQTFTTAQQTQARANISAYGSAEIGDPDTDLVTVYNTAKA